MRRLLAGAVALLSTSVVVTTAPTALASPSSLQRDTTAVHTAGAVGVAAVLTTPEGSTSAHSGTADLRTGAPVSPQAHFRAGSTTKAFVATVVLQLVGEGELSLDDTVEEWLPGVVTGNGNDGSGVTVRDLLQHTSGIPSYTRVPEAFPAGYSSTGYHRSRLRHHDAETLVAAAMTLPPDFRPGTAWRYSNTNYVLAGMLIESVTGRPWRTEVKDRVITPLGLTGTSLPGDDPFLPAPSVRGYHTYAGDARPTDTTVFNATAAGASGELVTTPRDVNRFLTALVTGDLLGPAEWEEMRRTHPIPDEPGRGYGLGLESTTLTCGGTYWHHGGNALGYASENAVTPDGARSVTVSVNSYDDADPDRQDRVDAAVRTLIDRALCAGGAQRD
ncbi:serine hydrolase [Wenjunlia vitaminophila]|uniref:Serine hydrolase n=1 Tax=Wenjunlia vitaminophila TaxID=76728 RepID=A0A0T6LPW1_WENVI|nr:serine hydrolase domain-containing protein [Wenjunlia vitaminophila]KRV48147.1 serine hydrolase [Wenjunlia vitaminophila]